MLVFAVNVFNTVVKINYVSVNEKLEIERKKSIAFIEKIIND